MARAQIKVTDHGYRKLMERAAELTAGAVVSVGVFEGGARKDGEATNAEIAAIHELGLGNAPERSWLRGWVDENTAQIIRNLKTVGKGIFKSTAEVRVGLNRFGLWAVGGIKQRIANRIAPPNAPATVEAKGSSTPLIDSGQFIGSIQHKTEMGQ